MSAESTLPPHPPMPATSDEAEAADGPGAPDNDDADWYGDSGATTGAADGSDMRSSFDSFGGEASVLPGEYGSVLSRMPLADEDAAEWRELERRMDAQRTPAFPIDLRKKLPLEAVWRRWRAIAMYGRSDVVDDFGRDPRATARWEWWFEFLYSKWFRVETTGLTNIPGHGRALLVANHAGSLPYDSAMLMHAVRRDHPQRRDVRPLVEDAVFHLPFLGPIMNRIGGVRAAPENAQRLLQNDELVAVFPEGVKGMGKLWKDRYQLQRFGRGGFVRLALRTQTPIIPVAIVGAEEATPMLGKITWFAKNVGLPWVPVTPTFPLLGPAGLLPLPSKWYIQFGEPIELAKQHPPEAADDRLLVNRLAEQIRLQIQSMIETQRAGKKSPLSAVLG